MVDFLAVAAKIKLFTALFGCNALGKVRLLGFVVLPDLRTSDGVVSFFCAVFQ